MAERRPGRATLPEPITPTRAAVVGCGTIGSAWAARFRLHGIPTKVFDPSPEAPRILDEVLANAVAAYQALGLPTDQLGELQICESIADAVADADLIQEAVPERLELKQATLAEIDAAAPPTSVIGSSTSGLLCTDMAKPLTHPERMVVAHPFVPVYLLPVVEIVGGEATSPDFVQQALSLYRGVGMRPIRVRAEIDAHIADRLLEAVWREALWLVHDGIATTEEIDDAMRYGFGLRWAQMGVFETYRIGGGEGGFGHFLEQFGPTLNWPWTKLMDVPDLDDELIDTLVEQSDSQSGAYEIRELERIRDANLTGMLLALEKNEWGAGEILAEMRGRLTTK